MLHELLQNLACTETHTEGESVISFAMPGVKKRWIVGMRNRSECLIKREPSWRRNITAAAGVVQPVIYLLANGWMTGNSLHPTVTLPDIPSPNIPSPNIPSLDIPSLDIPSPDIPSPWYLLLRYPLPRYPLPRYPLPPISSPPEIPCLDIPSPSFLISSVLLWVRLCLFFFLREESGKAKSGDQNNPVCPY